LIIVSTEIEATHLGAVAQVRGVLDWLMLLWPPATTMLAAPDWIC
jgi:hypothetical protein